MTTFTKQQTDETMAANAALRTALDGLTDTNANMAAYAAEKKANRSAKAARLWAARAARRAK